MKRVFLLDDLGAYGVGLVDAFKAQAEKIGMTVLGQDQLDPKVTDYSPVLSKINSLKPDALYYGGDPQAGVKLARQAYEIVPTVIKAAGDGMLSPDLLHAAGFPALAGCYVTTASPHLMDSDPKIAAFAKRFEARFNGSFEDYSVTCYVAAQVIVEAVRQVVAIGKTPDRNNVRDAIQRVKLADSLIGPVEFDENGDIRNKIISVFQLRKDDSKLLDDTNAQYHYIGIAPTF